MKIYIDLPWGGKLEFEREPMCREKFYALCGTIAGCVAVIAFFSVLR